MPLQVGDHRWFATLRQVTRGGTEQVLLGSQVPMPKLRRPQVGATQAHGDIDPGLDGIGQMLGEGHMGLQLRMLPGKFENRPQDLGPAECPRQVDAQLAAQLMLLRLQLELGLFQFGQHATASAVERQAGIGQGQAAGGTPEQSRLQPRFQAGDGLADGRRREVQAFAGRLEAATVGHADKHVDTLQAFGGKHLASCLSMNLIHLSR
ncbi:hypothetical protein P308_14330 [Pseudomonas piscis]|nr:hypothetical protein P308_14330 [Pseudomonas piscis]